MRITFNNDMEGGGVLAEAVAGGALQDAGPVRLLPHAVHPQLGLDQPTLPLQSHAVPVGEKA